MTTKTRAIELAKKLTRSNDRLLVEENKHWQTPEQFEALQQKRKALRESSDQINEWLKSVSAEVKDGSELLKAAEFACDVDGDEPSFSQLRDAAQKFKQYREAKDKMNDQYRQARRFSQHRSQRYQIGVYDNTCGLPMNLVLASGDTWAEVCENLQREIDRKGAKKVGAR